MNSQEQWLDALNRSTSLAPISPHNEGAARSAVRVHLSLAANHGDGPIGVVTDSRYLIPDAPVPTPAPLPPPGSDDARDLERLKTLGAKYNLRFERPKRSDEDRPPKPAKVPAKTVEAIQSAIAPPPAAPAPHPEPAPPPTAYRDPSKRKLEDILREAAANTAKMPFAGKDPTEKPFRQKKDDGDGDGSKG